MDAFGLSRSNVDARVGELLVPDALLGSARDRLAALDPLLDLRSQRGKMALLLLVAARVGSNVDRVARVARVEREVAAKFSRRLFDAGVEPRDFGDDTDAFWATVAIAEGRFVPRPVAVDDEPADDPASPAALGWPAAALPEPGEAAVHTRRAVAPSSHADLFPGARWLA